MTVHRTMRRMVIAELAPPIIVQDLIDLGAGVRTDARDGADAVTVSINEDTGGVVFTYPNAQ